MGDGLSGNHRGDAAPGPAPGSLTALLHELAAAPDGKRDGSWGDALVAGATIGRFQLVREVGRGGFGVVWEARDLQLGRSVAFKAVRAGGGEGLREERLLREAEAAARLSHPNLVTLHDVGSTPQGAYLVMELLRGRTLAERLQLVGPASAREAVHVATEVARGVAHAHAQGVIHRDLKPANVFLCEDGRVKVLDFGLAHAFGRRRAEGGTSGYMAPEQAEGAPEDERTDVYAMGVMLHELLTGERPAGGASPTGRAARIEVPGVPALGALVARMLERRPIDRPRDGGAVLAALTALARELEQAPEAHAAVQRSAPAWQRLALLAGGGVLAGAVVALAVAWWLSGRAPGAGPDGRITVAVADVANQTGDPELDGLSGLLITSLEQSRRLSVLTRVRTIDLLRQLGRTDVSVVDEAVGRDLARVAGVRALVVATLRRFDQLYTLEMRVLDPATSEYLFTLKEQGTGKASVPALLDRLSEEARRRLRETPDEVAASRVRVADATTASFTAYQHYFRGDQLKEAIRYDAAVAAYRQALAADPGFTLAHYRIAYLGQFTGMEEGEQRREIEAALAGVQRVPERERLHILAWKAHLDGRDDEAHRLYAQAVERYPQDKEAQFMAGDLYLHAGKIAEGLPFFERAAALDPTWEPGQMHLADSLAELGRTAELVQQATRWTERAPSASAFRALAMARQLEGRPAEAVSASRRALELDGTSHSRAMHAEALLLAGRYAEVEALVRPFAGPERSTLDRLFAVPALAAALAYQGRRREAVEVIRRAPAQAKNMHAAPRLMEIELTMGPRPDPGLAAELRALAQGLPAEKVGGLAVTLAALGDAAGARALLPADAPAALRLRVEGAAAWREGRLGPALEALRQAAKEDGGRDAGTQYLLGEVALAAGQTAEAVQATGRLRLVPGDLWRTWGWPRALQLQALALERMGDRTRARAAMAELLEMWRGADPDLPGLAEARATAMRLGVGG